MVREAEYAESKADFIHKMAIGLNEANETHYWLELLHSTSFLNDEEYHPLLMNVVSIKNILTSIMKTSKGI